MKFLLGLSAIFLGLNAFEINQNASLKAILEDAKECTEENCSAQIKECENDADCKKVLEVCVKRCADQPDGCWPQCIVPQRNKKADMIVKCAHDHHCIGPHHPKPEFKHDHHHIRNHHALQVADPKQCMQKYCSS